MTQGSREGESLAMEAHGWQSVVGHAWQEVEVGLTPREAVWEKDTVRLYHYLPTKRVSRTPLLIAYALINKPYILDLEPGRSVIQSLLAKGIDVYLIDWGIPTRKDMFLSTEDYVERYLDEAIDWILESNDLESISLLGYCLGGTVVSIYASLHPEKVRNLIVMATPIQFHCDGSLLHTWTKEEYLDADKLVKAFGLIPAELFTWTFKLLNPVGNLHLKYVDLWENADNEEYRETFFRMEKWIQDGVPMTGAFYQDLITKWYQKNQLVKGELAVDGRLVNLKKISAPVLTVTGSKDHIVPPESTEALLEFISSKDKSTIRCESGHIGLSVGGRAHKEVWPKVGKWLRQHSQKSKR